MEEIEVMNQNREPANEGCWLYILLFSKQGSLVQISTTIPTRSKQPHYLSLNNDLCVYFVKPCMID